MNFQIKKRLLGGYSVKYECPRCKTGLSSALTDAGRVDACPDCQATFTVPGAKERDELQLRLAEDRERINRERAETKLRNAEEKQHSVAAKQAENERRVKAQLRSESGTQTRVQTLFNSIDQDR